MAPRTGKGRGNRGKGDKKKKEEKGIVATCMHLILLSSFFAFMFDD